MRISLSTVLVLAILSTAAFAQKAAVRVSSERVSEILKYISSDEMAGRDTPSLGLKRAQEWSLERFKDCGLEPALPNKSWYFEYDLSGRKLDLADCQAHIKVGQSELDLKPVEDFRFLSASVAYLFKDTVTARMSEADAIAKGLMMRRSLKAPVIVEVENDSPLWISSEAGEFSSNQRDLGAAVLLVRQGLIPAGKIQLDLKSPEPQNSLVKERNLVGLLKGRTRPDEFVMVTAHLDHVGVGLPMGKDKKDRIYNGANDNGTGSTAVIEIARVLAELTQDQRPDRSILFVLFSGEEKGLLGSRAMAKNSPWPLDKIVVQINMEMLGRPTKGMKNMVWVTWAGHSNFEEIVADAVKRAGVSLTSFAMAEQLYQQSDNWPYAQKGVVAHSISASGMDGIDYHKPQDEFDRIDLKHMTKVMDGIAEVVLEFANREEAPKRKD